MNKTIIAVYGRSNEGKSQTIKIVCQLLINEFPNAKPAISPINYDGDILVSIKLGEIKIGFESQGDPNSRMITEQTIQKLADISKDAIMGDCDVIICATRTEGNTVKTVDKIAVDYDYNIVWISSFFSPKLDADVLNRMAAKNIIEIIKSLIVGQL